MNILITDLLTQIEAPGTFATRLRAPTEGLEVEVTGVGPLEFPISPQIAQNLRRVACASPFGLRDQTLHDPSVRNSWEVAASQVKIDEQRWTPVFANYLRTLQTDLGLPDECELEAVFDKLLLYEEGQFFKPHQDSEKDDQMFGTLVVILPSEYSGGAVTVEHRGEKKVFRRIGSQTKDLSLLAFYADCHHAVSPIKSGVRVALTYQLRLKGSSKAALPQIRGNILKRLTTYVREHFEKPVIKRYSQSAAAPPERLVYLLDHEYTQRSLSWNHLKNGDRARVAALRAVAGRLNCECSLALAEVHETWTCEDEYPDYRYGRRRWRYDEEEEDSPESDSEEYELNDLIDSTIELNHWLDIAGAHAEGVPGFVNDEELHFTKPSSDMHPFRSEYEGYQGNYGNTLDRWYHRAAFVMWPRANTFALRAQALPQWAVDELLAFPRANTAELESRVKTLLPRWSQTAGSVDDTRFFAKLIKLSTRINDSALAHGWLLPLGLHRLGSQAMRRDLVTLVDKHGLPWAKELIVEWTKNHHWGLAPWVPLLADICGDLHASNSTASKTLAAWLLQKEVKIALERCTAAFKRPSPWLDLDAFTEESTHLAHVLATAVAISAFPVIDETSSVLLNGKQSVPTPFLVSLLRACIARSPALGSQIIGSPLHRECIARLGAIVREPVRATGDWTIAYPLICTCNDCKVLAHFLGSARTEHDWPLKKERRQHIHNTIDSAKLPIRHMTLRKGSPYVLQLRKDDSLFSRERSYRLRVKQILDALPAAPSQ